MGTKNIAGKAFFVVGLGYNKKEQRRPLRDKDDRE